MTSPSRPTLRDVARIAGVSHNTVSLVVRDSGRVLPATRERVQAVIDRLGYQPHAAAAALRSARTGTIGYLIHRGRGPEVATEVDAFRNHMWRGISDTAEQSEYFVLQAGFPDQLRRRALLSSGRIDGLLVDMLVPDAILDELRAGSPCPIVVVGRSTEVTGVGWVAADEEGGAYDATRHLIDSGCDSVGVLTVRSDSHPIVRAREAGVRRACDEAGAASPRHWFGEWTFESGVAVGQDLAADSRRPEAVFALNELMAAGCLQGLAHAGINVPGDLAIMTVEDSPWVNYVQPTLSAVHVPVYSIAQRATEILLAAVINDAPPGNATLPTELVIRGSSR